MVNEATFSATGYVATEPKLGWTRDGTRTLFMRVGWTPRRLDKRTGEWADQATSFVSVICYRRVAENASNCLRRGDPVVVKGTLRVREYGEENGPKRSTVEVLADSIGHDLSKGTSFFKKSTAQLEKTAAERERESGGSARDPLLGDRDTGQWGSGESDGYFPGPDDDELASGEFSGAGLSRAGFPETELPETELAGAELPGSGMSGAQEFDDEEARQLLADAEDAAEPVGAAN